MIREFLRAERGSVSIEALIILPVLVLFYIMSFTFYDAYRTQTVVTKAGYTVADLISRQSGTVTANDIEGMASMYRYITRGRDNSGIRVTSVRRRVQRDPGNPIPVVDVYEVANGASYATNGRAPMTTEELQTRLVNVPQLFENESVTIVETFTPYRPPFFIGLDPYTMEAFLVTRQRSGLPIDLDPTPIPTNVTTVSNP